MHLHTPSRMLMLTYTVSTRLAASQSYSECRAWLKIIHNDIKIPHPRNLPWARYPVRSVGRHIVKQVSMRLIRLPLRI